MGKRSGTYERNPNPRGTGNGGWIVGAIIVILVIIGLFYWGGTPKEKASSITEQYGQCSVSNVLAGRYNFDCPNPSAFHAAIDEFAKRNPQMEIKGLFAEKK